MSDQAKAWAEAQTISDPGAKAVLLALATRHRDGDDVVRVDWRVLLNGAVDGAAHSLFAALYFLHARRLIKLPCITDTMTITLLMDDERAERAAT